MRVKVTSKSFSRTPDLTAELADVFDDCVFRPDGPGQLTAAALVDYLADADAVILGLDPMGREVLDRLPRLKAVAKYGVGLDNLDVATCLKRGIHVGWSPGVNRRSVSELALACILSLLRNAWESASLLSAGEWRKQGGVQLTGKTVGIVGVGHIGRDLIGLLRPFGCRVLGCDILPMEDWFAANGVAAADFSTILREADVISLHAPLTRLTHHMVDAAALRAMKPTAVLINTARGPIVDQAALKQALSENWIAGAALDVYDGPEPPPDTAFLALPNLMCTPHIGGNAQEAVLAMGRSAIAHLKAWRDGAPQPELPTQDPLE
jgi:D-3-phosphoglycerate dehydrogenase